MGVVVFGIEGVPLFEMLLIVLALMLMGLIFMLLEVRKLRKLIGQEKADIKRFESDLADFERAEGKKPTTNIVGHVRNAMDKGISKEQIQSSMLQRGWPKQHVDKILQDVK